MIDIRIQKTLEELADDYLEAVEILEKRISERRKKLLPLAPFSREASTLKSELNVLYRERSDTLQAAEFLKKYYINHKEEE